MIEYIIEIQSGDTCVQSAEIHVLQPTHIHVFSKICLSDLIVVASSAIKEIDAYLRTVQTERELLLELIVLNANILQFECVS